MSSRKFFQPSNPALYEGLEMQLQQLMGLHLETLGDVDQPLACIVCFALEADCTCPAPILWPLNHVILYLQAYLERLAHGA